jgi:indole-3-glycerol phosphate synthase
MRRAVACGAKLIGVNNRDLRTFEVSLETSLSLAREVPPDGLLISESGLNNAADLQRLYDAGYRGFLIGETLMRADDPAAALRSFRGLK